MGVSENIINLLQTMDANDKNIGEIEKQIEYMKKKNAVSKIFDLSKVRERGNGQFYIYVNRKQITAPAEAALIEKLYEMEFGLEKSTLESLFPEYMIYKRDKTTASSKTLKEYVSIWENHYAGTKLSQKPIKDLTAAILTDFFENLVKQKNLTYSRYTDIKGVVSAVLKYAIRLDIIQNNAADFIDPQNFRFRSPASAKRRKTQKIISTATRDKMLAYFDLDSTNDIYDLAIMFALHNTLRIGEIKALKPSDIDYEMGCIWVDTQIIEERKMNDNLTFEKRVQTETNHIKGGTEKGVRALPLSPASISILKKVQELNPDSEYLFSTKNGCLSTVTFNRHLKKMCASLSVYERSSHDLRFSGASELYAATKDITQVQTALGHTTLAMTSHYLTPVISMETQHENYIKALG